MIAASFSVDKGLHKSLNIALYKFHMKCVYLNQKWVQDQFIHWLINLLLREWFLEQVGQNGDERC